MLDLLSNRISWDMLKFNCMTVVDDQFKGIYIKLIVYDSIYQNVSTFNRGLISSYRRNFDLGKKNKIHHHS